MTVRAIVGCNPRRWLHLSLYRLKGKLRTAGVHRLTHLLSRAAAGETIHSPALGPALRRAAAFKPTPPVGSH